MHGDTLESRITKRIFISSPFQELQEERKAIQRALNRMSFAAVTMEHFGSFPHAPIDRCVMLVKTADYFVMLVGRNLGTMIPGSDRTYTEEEYHAAIEGSIPVLAYFKPGGPFPRVDAFRETVGGRHGFSFFTSPDDLSWKVVSDLAREALMAVPGRDSAICDPEEFMFQRFEQEKGALIQRLNIRADMVCARFQKNAQNSTTDALEVFRRLHSAHIEHIDKGRFGLAHETLRDIYNLLDTVAATHGIDDLGRMYQRSVPTPLQHFVRCNYLLGSGDEPPSSPFSTIRLYDRLLDDSSLPKVHLPFDTISEGT